MIGDKPHLQDVCEIRNSYHSNTDLYGIWESNMPIYYLPSINVLPDIIHLCCANYDPTQRKFWLHPGLSGFTLPLNP